jgi:hypothetical protein
MEQCQSLKVLTLQYLELDENHCRVLGAYSRPGLKIELIHCTFTSAGTIALGEVLGRNQGPTSLDWCDIDDYVLANGLRGNSRLKSLVPHFSANSLEDNNRQVLAITDALRENKGLIELNLRSGLFCVSNEIWHAICDSLKAHPTLKVLHLRTTFANDSVAPAVLKTRIQALVDMLKVNMSIHTIHLDSRYSQHELFRGSVIPHLETNKLRGRIRAIQRTLPITYRAKVLGRALVSARAVVNSFWMLLSGNAEVAFPSTATRTMLVTNLPSAGASANAQPGTE